ncbi:MAG: hypothetical protein COA91_13315 [Robiginitomaculum sp.]|nr:MAG: hypothetical protein COA91_13315 [Robiginitomaculum sp.]
MEKLATLKPWLLKLAIGLAVFMPVYFIVAALGTKFGVWGWQFGFGKLTFGFGPKLIMLTFVVAALALVLSVIIKPRKGWLIALLCLAVPMTGFGLGQSLRAKAGKLPPIHDISTDIQTPPLFGDAVTALREKSKCSNTLDYLGKTFGKDKILVSEAQVKAYPDIRTLVFTKTTDAVFEKALNAAKSMGWEIVSSSKDTGMIEARATSFWYGFSDDVAVRIRPAEGGGTLVDIRSISCVGGSDIGVNAARIREFRSKL